MCQGQVWTFSIFKHISYQLLKNLIGFLGSFSHLLHILFTNGKLRLIFDTKLIVTNNTVSSSPQMDWTEHARFEKKYFPSRSKDEIEWCGPKLRCSKLHDRIIANSVKFAIQFYHMYSWIIYELVFSEIR